MPNGRAILPTGGQPIRPASDAGRHQTQAGIRGGPAADAGLRPTAVSRFVLWTARTRNGQPRRCFRPLKAVRPGPRNATLRLVLRVVTPTQARTPRSVPWPRAYRRHTYHHGHRHRHRHSTVTAIRTVTVARTATPPTEGGNQQRVTFGPSPRDQGAPAIVASTGHVARCGGIPGRLPRTLPRHRDRAYLGVMTAQSYPHHTGVPGRAGTGKPANRRCSARFPLRWAIQERG